MTSRSPVPRAARRSNRRSFTNPFRRRRLLSVALPILIFCAFGLLAVLCLELMSPLALDPDSDQHAAVMARLGEILQHFESWK